MALRFLEVRPSTVQAGGRWLPVPEVQVEILHGGLVPARFSIVAEEIGDISKALTEQRFLERQTIRAFRKEWFSDVGSAGAIDVVAPAVLTRGGHDVPEVIRRMRDSENGLPLGSANERMYLSWDNGLIDVDVSIGEGVSYKAGKLTIDLSRMPRLASYLRGQQARTIVDSDLLDGAIISSVGDHLGKHVITLEPRYAVFDAKTFEPREQIFPM